ncbi:MAG: cation-translocating P-type ATPase [Candidatus Schekmanbacteria bacterium]|nr:cation-translocating P-type ATPase [Candidatus Schekmanbacteria bacterium]
MLKNEPCCDCNPDQPPETSSRQEHEYNKSRTRVIITGILATSCMMLELHLVHLPHLVNIIIGLAAVVIGGYPLAYNAYSGLKQKKLNVDALVIIASGAALILGEYLEAATVIFILLLGEELERYTVYKANSAIKGLAHLLPAQVRIKEDTDGEKIIPLSAVTEGMIVIVKPGERIAVDGRVVMGHSVVDQSPITGESLPLDKTLGSQVFSGTLNLSGALYIEAERVGEKTTVARIEQMTQGARMKKATLQQLVNQVAGWFVPAVLVLAGIVYWVTADVQRAITILIVTCPCAFVLATPIAVVAAMGAAAKKGILIKGGAVLETCSKLNSFVFDKTGTLTYGQPEIVNINTVCSRECTVEDTLTFAAVADKLSQHPLAEAILEKAKNWELMISTPDDFVVKHGQGVIAQHDDIKIILGNHALLTDNQIAISQDIADYIQKREKQGETVLLVAHHKQVCGIISLADTIRSDAPQTIRQLKDLGIDKTLALYTGDNYEIARLTAQRLGIDEFAATLLPEQKVAKIKELIQRGYRVGLVGDGINDAPALAASHVGIAMGLRGSDLAAHASDVTFLTDDLSKIPLVIKLGRRTFSVIKQNIWFALVFNTMMLYLASVGIISMITGALAHQVSSLAVILNSMRLISASNLRQAAGNK